MQNIKVLHLFISFLYSLNIVSQENIVFSHFTHQSMIPSSLIDSITIVQPPFLKLYTNKKQIIDLPFDTAYFNKSISDTLVLNFHDNWVYVQNPHLDWIKVETNQANVTINSTGKTFFVCLAKGKSNNGRIIINNDTTFSLILDNLNLRSNTGSCIWIKNNYKSSLILPEGSVNFLTDASSRDSLDLSNGCLYSKGTIGFLGKGTLNVEGNYKHGISSSKNINIDKSSININNVLNNGIHCDKFHMYSGTLFLNLTNNASKGIKAKESISIHGGTISGIATGDVLIENGETSYCTFLKSNSNIYISSANLNLKHLGKGGRCLSADGTIQIKQGSLFLESNGDGGEYTNSNEEKDYYTSKCITANKNIYIERGNISLLSKGQGGKGLDCSDSLFLGRKDDDFINNDSLFIQVETFGSALVDNIEEDYRKGCPKAIKADNYVEIYSGNFYLYTHGSGGEGIECKNALVTRNATLLINSYDDAINVEKRGSIYGSNIYCHSQNNDGIDSNGKFTINYGIVVSISEHEEDESFDTNPNKFFINGGIVFGIGNDKVDVGEAYQSYYSTSIYDGLENPFTFTGNHYLCVTNEDSVIMSLKIPSNNSKPFITISHPNFRTLDSIELCEIDDITKPSLSLFDNSFLLEGKIEGKVYKTKKIELTKIETK